MFADPTLADEIKEARANLRRLTSAARGERCKRPTKDDHEWRCRESIGMIGGGIDLRKFGGSRSMYGWQVWECNACHKWALATYGGELLRVLTAAAGKKLLEGWG